MGVKPLRIGCASGFTGDRLDAALPVVEELVKGGGPACLVFETLGERTLALAQLRRRQNPDNGYFVELDELLAPILRPCLEHHIPIIGNFGAANPVGAAQRVLEIARALGCGPIKVAAVTGDDLLAQMPAAELLGMPFDPPTAIEPQALVAVNVYLGADGIVAALAQGADVIVTGRVADSSLALGPLLHHFGWRPDDWDLVAAGVLAGHLLECGTQVTGGYFADPGFKDVPELARVGYPIAEVNAAGEIIISKPAGTGGTVSVATVKEQLLYEIHDPGSYLTPDVTLDLTEVSVSQIGVDRVLVRGARGTSRPTTLKGTVCFDGGWIGESEISYAGPNCKARGLLAIAVLKERLAALGLNVDSHFDLIGVASVFNDERGEWLDQVAAPEPPEVRVRLAAGSQDRRLVERAIREVEGLYTNGPAGGGGVRATITPAMNSTSVFVDRGRFESQVAIIEGRA